MKPEPTQEDVGHILEETPHLASDLRCGGRGVLRGRSFTELRGRSITEGGRWVLRDGVLPCNQRDDVRGNLHAKGGVRIFVGSIN